MGQTRRYFGKSAAAGVLGILRPELQAAVRPRPKLLILIVATQFRPEYLDRTDRLFGPGGFRRLIDDGAFFPDCRCAAGTFPSSALATLATGCWPEVHGIVADTWYDRTTRRAVPAQAEALLAPALAAEAAAAPHTRVFVCAMQQSHAALFGASAATRTIFMGADGSFATLGEAPPWLTEYNRLHPMDNVHDAKWVAVGAGAGVPALRTLAYDSAHPEQFLALYRASPFAQAAQFGVLRELIARERLGQGETQDLLVLCLDSMDLLGYEVGADSPLMEQMTLHLDREIGLTLEFLNKAPGTANYALVFTGAHGAPAAPAADRRARIAVSGEALAHALDRSLSERYDGAARTSFVEKYVYPFLYLRPDALRMRSPREVREFAGRAALAMPAVAAYYTADGDCSYRGDWERRFRNSFHALRSGDVMLAYRPGYIEEYGSGRGISYGSLYNYDARVPLVLYGPPFRAGTFERPVELIDIAPTLARIAGVPGPSSSTGRVLAEALAPAAARK